MPGFNVNGVGAGAPADFEAFYNYTWKISNFGGTKLPDGIMCQDSTLPTYTIKTEEGKGTSLTYKYASEIEWDPITITFYDTIKLYESIKGWRRAVWNEEDGLGVASSYKKQSIVEQYLPDESKTVSWTLFGSWPSSIRYGDLSYVGSTAKFVTVILTYDWAVEATS